MQNRPFSSEVIFSSIPALLPYLLVTLEVGLISILTGSILGMLLAWAKLSSHKVLRCAADGYTYDPLHPIHCSLIYSFLWSAQVDGVCFFCLYR